MKDKLKNIGLLRESAQRLDIPKDTFISFFSAMIGVTQEVKIFGKPSYPYFGYVNETNFEITENQKPFGNTSSAKVTGEIRSTERGIELRFESLLLAQREYLFIGAGVLMFISGIIKLFFESLLGYRYNSHSSIWIVFDYLYICIYEKGCITCNQKF